MANWKELEKKFAARLALGRRPVAVTFLDAEPAGVPKFSGTEPAGCSFWRLAAAGRTFYTVPADHFNCAVGSVHAQHSASARSRPGNRDDAGHDVQSRLRAARRSSRNPAPCQGTRGGCFRAAWGCACCAERRAVCVQDFRGHAAQRSFDSRGRRQRAAAARPAVVHGASRGARARDGFDAWAASAIACTPGLGEDEMYVVVPGAKTWKPSPTRSESSPRRMPRWRNSRAGGRRRSRPCRTGFSLSAFESCCTGRSQNLTG